MARQLIIILILLTSTVSINSCKENNDSETTENNISDGKYCAKIKYYNPNSGTNKTYKLFVEVENNLLTKIYWPNGGWLDESHFTPKEIIDDHVFIESDNGYEYNIQIGFDENECEICYTEIEENRKNDSIKAELEIEKLELERKKLEFEAALLEEQNRIANYGHRVYLTGCKDMLIIEYSESFVVAQKIGLPFEVNAGDRLDCQISKLGITSIGDLTSHDSGNIKVLAITSTRELAKYKYDEICTEYIKSWKYD